MRQNKEVTLHLHINATIINEDGDEGTEVLNTMTVTTEDPYAYDRDLAFYEGEYNEEITDFIVSEDVGHVVTWNIVKVLFN